MYISVGTPVTFEVPYLSLYFSKDVILRHETFIALADLITDFMPPRCLGQTINHPYNTGLLTDNYACDCTYHQLLLFCPPQFTSCLA